MFKCFKKTLNAHQKKKKKKEHLPYIQSFSQPYARHNPCWVSELSG